MADEESAEAFIDRVQDECATSAGMTARELATLHPDDVVVRRVRAFEKMCKRWAGM